MDGSQGRGFWGKVRYPGERRALTVTVLVTGAVAVVMTLSQLWVLAVFLGFIALQIGQMRVALMGSSVRLGPAQFPDIQSVLEECAHRLEIRKLPACYIRYSPVFNASTFGFFRHVIVLHSALVERYSPEELAFIIGHELGHEKFQHTRLSLLTGPLRQVSTRFLDFSFLFNWWGHRKEYTADRCGLLACRNLKASVTALVKLSIGDELFHRMNIKEFLRQLADLEKGRTSKMGELWRTHPFLIKRVRQIVEFFYSDAYRNITGKEKGAGIDASALPTFLRRESFTLLRNVPPGLNLGGVLDTTPGCEDQFQFTVLSEDGRIEGLPMLFQPQEDGDVIVAGDGTLEVNGRPIESCVLRDGDRIAAGEFRGIYRTMRT